MKNCRRNFIIDELMVQGFIEYKDQEILLEENDEGGESELRVMLTSERNLCIANVDKKNTEFQFFQKKKEKALYKRVDHMIFERQDSDTWKLHLIEMKSNVGGNTWKEIKGKFRSSYLFAQAIAGILELTISETVMYTTFEKVQLIPSETTPTARRPRTGEPVVKMQEEWDGHHFVLNFGEWIPFLHIPVLMVRNEKGVLEGTINK